MIHHIERAAPTPLTSSMHLFFQLAACRKWPARVKDAKTAFLQSKPTTRLRKLARRMPQDEAFEGYRDDQLIVLNTEVYRLVSGPAWWRRSFLEILVMQLGYRINCFDRCVLTLDSESREANAATRGMIVIEVDDVLEAGNVEHQRRMSALETMLKFGEAVELQSDAAGTGFAGRRVWQEADCSFSITMRDYIQSRLKPVRLESKTLKCQAKDKVLNAEEVSQLRGTLASINWVAREGRPDASAAASILAGCFPTPSVADATEAKWQVEATTCLAASHHGPAQPRQGRSGVSDHLEIPEASPKGRVYEPLRSHQHVHRTRFHGEAGGYAGVAEVLPVQSKATLGDRGRWRAARRSVGDRLEESNISGPIHDCGHRCQVSLRLRQEWASARRRRPSCLGGRADQGVAQQSEGTH